MGQPPDQPSEEKGLSAHEAGKFAPHGKTNYDPDAALPERPAGVTAREEEIANLLAEDLTNAQISEKTGIEIATVKTHVHNLLGKIKGRTRTSAIIWVWRRRVEIRDREILILKELLAQQGSSAASETQPE
jgi:DNA-binding NarL/FixJ family response regulator